MRISDGVARRLRPYPYRSPSSPLVLVPIRPPAVPPPWHRSSSPAFPQAFSEMQHQQALLHVRSLADRTIDDVVLDNEQVRQPSRMVRELLDTFLQYHGYAENTAEFQKPKAERDPAVAYHHGLDMVCHRRTRHGSYFFLTAGPRSMLVETKGTSYSLKTWNTARSADHQSCEHPPDIDGNVVHTQVARYNRSACSSGFFPLQFHGQTAAPAGEVRYSGFPSIRLNNKGDVKPHDYEALETWFTGLWRHAGLSILFDKGSVDYVVQNEPTGAHIVRPVMDGLQRAYVDTVRESIHAHFSRRIL